QPRSEREAAMHDLRLHGIGHWWATQVYVVVAHDQVGVRLGTFQQRAIEGASVAMKLTVDGVPVTVRIQPHLEPLGHVWPVEAAAQLPRRTWQPIEHDERLPNVYHPEIDPVCGAGDEAQIREAIDRRLGLDLGRVKPSLPDSCRDKDPVLMTCL